MVGGDTLATATSAATLSIAGTVVTLAQNNTIKGISIGNSTTDILGSNFGTLTIDDVSLGGTGRALNLSNGAFAAGSSFDSVTSTSGGININLGGISGSVDFGSGTLSGATVAAFNISGGTVSTTYSGNISTTFGVSAVSVSSGHATGTVAFSGTINGGGTGLQFSNADGTYNFTGTTTLNGDDAGIDIVAGADGVSGSTGTFSFGANTTINHNAFGDAFTLTGSDANVTYSGSITDNNGRAVVINDHDSGTVTFQTGSITSSGASAQGIQVINSSGGSVNFNGQTTLSTTTNNAVDMSTGNTGGTVNFNSTGSGLDITTSSGIGFNAAGGGTVTVQGTGNTISSGTGTALNIANTNIGANDVNFQSINTSTASASAGIVLNNTGTLGGLTITGTGAAAGTGGTISNKTGNGIELTNTRDVSLSNMVIDNNDGAGDFAPDPDVIGGGIVGTNVTNFSLIGSTISNNSNQADGTEAGLRFNNLLGVSAITNSTFSGQAEDHVRITNSSGTLTNLTVSGSTFNANSAATGGHGISMINTGSSVATLTVNTTNFTDIRSSSVLMNVSDSATGDLSVTGGTFTDIGVAVTMGVSFNADLGFNVSGITSTRAISNAIQLVAGSTTTNASNIVGTITGNTIGNGTADSGSRDMFGIAVDLRGDQDSIIAIDNNNVRNTDFEGIWVSSADFGTNPAQHGVLDLHVRDNTVGAPDDNSGFPVGLIRGTLVDVRHTTEATLDMSGNTSAGIGGGEGFRVRQRDTSVLKVERLTDGDGTPNEIINNVTTLEAFIAGQNDAGSTADVLVAIGFTEAANGAARDPLLAGGAAPDGPDDTQPASDPHPPVDPIVIFEAPPSSQGASDPVVDPPVTPASPIVDDGVLSQAELAFLVDAAITRWNDAGLSAAQVAHLDGIDFSVAALGSRYLGLFSPDGITLDNDGAGSGWFLDATPFDDSEFANAIGTRLTAASGSAPAGRYDLLTTLMHEMGHALGLGDSYADSARDDLMFGWLFSGERRFAGQGDAIGAVAGSIAEEEFLTAPVNVGTLGPGQQVTVQWTATVNGQNNQLIDNPVNQGTVTADGGISVQTDGDGNFGNGNQANTTALDTLVLGDRIFNDTNGDGGFDAGEGVSGVALTLWADNNVVGGDGDFDPGAGAGFDTQITTTTSGVDGLYSFTGLAPGDYIVQVNQSNFGAGGVLELLKASVPGAVDPDNNSDTDENGVAVPGQGHVTGVITLAYNTEPTPGTGNDTNNTLDIGVLSSAPVITTSPGSAAFIEGVDAPSTPVAVDPGLTLTDPDSTTLTLATAQITGNFSGGQDVLGFTNTSGALYGDISGSFVGDTLTLSSALGATVAQFQNALSAVTYTNLSNTPITATRTITFSATDPDDTDSSPQTRQVTVAASNDSPVNSVPGTQFVDEDGALAFGAATLNSLGVSDPDADPINDVITVVLSIPAGAGALQVRDDIVGGLAAGDISGNGANSVTLTGSRNAITNTLGADSGVTYTPTSNFNSSGGITLTVATDDQGFAGAGGAKTDSDNITIIVTALNDAPALAGLDNAPTFTENGAAVVLDGDATVSDIDLDAFNAGAGDYAGSSLTVARNGGADTADNFAFNAVGALFTVNGSNLQAGGLTFATFASVAGTLTVNFTSSATTATSALVDNVLQRITYLNANDTPPASVTLDYVFNDGSASANQGGGLAAATATGSITVNITAADDAPVAVDDAVTTNEATILNGDVFAMNPATADSDVDGPALAVSEVNGLAASVGNEITLASGAKLTLNAGGTFSYNPNGAFNDLPGPTSGASNLSRTDSFTYRLAGGNTATVTVTVTGLDSVGDKLDGSPGVDRIDGGAGADEMRGFGGSDGYIVDSANDKVFEAVGGGAGDIVLTSVDYTLGAGQEIEILAIQNSASINAMALYGNGFGNRMGGNQGVNRMDGGGGADTMFGYGGSDGYVVDNANDLVNEAVGGGDLDVVATSVSYVLRAGQEVEVLFVHNNASTNAINLTGNEFANRIGGNAGVNQIDGGGGADAMFGYGGNDFYRVDNVGDRVNEAVGGGALDMVVTTVNYKLTEGQEIEILTPVSISSTNAINLIGNEFANRIGGNEGVNRIDGGGGGDALFGYGGDDVFIFRKGQANGDTVYDFAGNGAAAGDSFEFTGYGPDATFAALDATHWRITYNGGASHETITIANGASIHTSDFVFA